MKPKGGPLGWPWLLSNYLPKNMERWKDGKMEPKGGSLEWFLLRNPLQIHRVPYWTLSYYYYYYYYYYNNNYYYYYF